MSNPCRQLGIAIAAAALLLFPAFGQTTSTSTTTDGSTATGGATVPPASSTGGGANSGSNGQPRFPQAMRVTGRVMVDDGTAPTSPAVIERVCNGNARSEGYADGHGYFSVLLGQETDVIGEASDTNFSRFSPTGVTGSGGAGSGAGMGRTGSNNRLGNCELRARLGGYRSQSISLANRSPFDTPDVGVILIHRIAGREEGATVTATTLKAPKAARKALQKGMDLAKKNKPEDAIARLREAVKADPEFAFAWCELGKLQAQNGRAADARQSFEAAAKAEPRWPEPYLRLALIAGDAHNWQEAADDTDRVARLDSFSYPQAFYLNAVANVNLRHMDLAERSALHAEKLDVQHRIPRIAHLLGIIFAANHRYAEAADRFRAYLILAPNAPDAPALRAQVDQMEKMAAASSQMARKEPQ